jgi:predicted transcriptional regulator of viral defense system
LLLIVGIYKYIPTLCYNKAMQSTKETILDLARQKGILRARDLDGQKLSRVLLSRLVGEGRLLQLSRGLYSLPDRVVTEQGTLAEVAIKYPNSVFCLLTALQIHELTTQSPHQVWLAIDAKARAPQMDYPPLKVVRFSREALEAGAESVMMDGVVSILVTSIEKTIVDCFKYRNKIGLDIAIEALQEAWRSKRMSMDKIWEFAKICRVTNVMRPYLESLNG